MSSTQRKKSAPKHAVEFRDPRRLARRLQRLHLGQALQLAWLGQRAVAVGRNGFGNRLHQSVPRQAVRALPLPLGDLTTAFGAGVAGFLFGHVTPSPPPELLAPVRTAIRS